jgi:hypothetical protein
MSMGRHLAAGLLAAALCAASSVAAAETPGRSAADAPRGNELNRRLARGGLALELLARLAKVGYAAGTCHGDDCDHVASMLPVVGGVAAIAGASSPEQRGRATALAAFEVSCLTLAAVGVWDAWTDERGARIRVGLRGPGLLVAGEY